jgi:hypothetical protein
MYSYIPLFLPINTYENYFLALNELYLANPEAYFIILSDFNLPSIDWSLYYLPFNCHSQINSYFTSMLSQFNLYQFNLIRNHNNVI